MPDVDHRNKAMLDAWRKSPNHQVFTESIGSRFPVTKYRRVKNINVFEEHTLPATKAPDGSAVPPRVYNRDELAAMVEGMNDRIADHEHFSPISKGHTIVDQNGDLQNDPDVLGYAGPYYLGKFGKINPRWGIFTDEYHRIDSIPELDKRRGRSPEVWPYPNARDRFFHPIAALAAEMPRLNLMPTRYSRRAPDGSGDSIMVEYYSATSAYGANSATPQFQSPGRKQPMMTDNYGQPGMAAGAENPAGGGDVAGLVDEIIGGLMETPLFQFLAEQYQQHQAVNSQPPGAPETPMMQPDAGQEPMAAAAPESPGTPGPAPGAIPDQMRQDQYSRKIRQLESQLEESRKALQTEQSTRVRIERYSRLSQLADEFEMDADDELERTNSFSADQFDDHCKMIQDRYRRNVSSIPDFASLARIGDHKEPAIPGKVDSLSKDDVDNIAALAATEGLKYSEARDRYQRNKKQVAAAS